MLAYEMDGKPLPRAARRPGPARDPGHVRLQERQVGQPHRARDRDADAATGSSTATTWTHGSAGRMATSAERGPARPDRALHPHRAGAPLDARDGLLHAPRDRADPLPPGALDADQPPPARQERPHLGRGRLGDRDRRDHRRRQPQAARRGLARDRDDRPRRPPLAARPPRAAGPLQCGPEDQRAADRRLRAAVRALRASSSGSASATTASSSTAPAPSTTCSRSSPSASSSAISTSR